MLDFKHSMCGSSEATAHILAQIWSCVAVFFTCYFIVTGKFFVIFIHSMFIKTSAEQYFRDSLDRFVIRSPGDS